MQKPELLAPAGDLEKLKTAVIYGADAVYLGGRQFSLRAGAANFSPEELLEGVEFAHQRGARVYAAVNIFAHNQDLDLLPGYISELRQAGVDGVIASDPGVITVLRNGAPDLPIHLSTQANTTNWLSAEFWRQQGVKRIVLARELSLKEIGLISKKVDVETEVFIHGAMCMAYSGRCLLSNYLTGRDANRGDCAQPCRWKYQLVEEKRPGQYFPVQEEERGSYFMSSRDLCLIEYIPQLVEAGVNSFKIEGRMKSMHYVATVVKCYRRAIDEYFKDPENYTFDSGWLEEISKVSHRDYTTGFLLGQPGGEAQSYKKSQYTRNHRFVGVVRQYDAASGLALVEQRNNFAVGDTIEVFQPQGDNFTFTVEKIFDEENNPQTKAPHPQQLIKVPVQQAVEEWSMLRQKYR
ncbi:peptidase U32 family protein [Desulfofalx alkaliphila]|uniref:peptidase U32 family protein n=1 Tax=Desulfofalx alkaliphila TaxID=105483 RepID=UPI0004E1CEA3|nr:U32 family peptidase [Desulfofalx alkaliphila]